VKVTRFLIALFALPTASFGAEDGTALGFYLGAGAGLSDIRDSAKGHGSLGGFSKNDLGLRAAAGIRPLSWLGVEAAYTYYGKPSGTYAGQSVTTEAKTTSISALVYLPLSNIDLYGKFGYANNDGKLSYKNVYEKLSGTGQLYGVGAEYSFSNWKLRGEFEYMNTSYQDATFLSLNFIKPLF
jgi:outer membrane protein with beta-barrel domain